jgi:hypothetical protein
MKKKKRKNDARDADDEVPICGYQTPEMMLRDGRAKSTRACLFCISFKCGLKMDKMEAEETCVELMNS